MTTTRAQPATARSQPTTPTRAQPTPLPTTTARVDILNSIHTALRNSQPPRADTRATPAPSPPTAAPPPDALTRTFAERLRNCGATVTECAQANVRQAVSAICERHGATRLATPPELPSAWCPPQLELINDTGLSAHELDSLDGVITGAALGIAESATIALNGSPDQGRRALTLIPDLHICIIETTGIVATLPDALTQLTPSITAEHRPIILITGPSATSDIELQRVQGVHGPRRLEVIIAHNNPPTPA